MSDRRQGGADWGLADQRQRRDDRIVIGSETGAPGFASVDVAYRQEVLALSVLAFCGILATH